MFHQLSDLQRLRKKYNLTQKDLALESGVSQSLIAKIESGQVEPTYSKTVNLFQALERHRAKDEIKAKDIMTKKVIAADKNSPVRLIISIMKKHHLSQVPITEADRVCGLVTEGVILKKITAYSGKVGNLKAVDLMEEVPPMIPQTTGIRTILELLRESPVVLVIKEGKPNGIISKSDLLGRTD